MLFNSINFALFLPLIFILYWFVFSKNLKSQNVLLLVASYFFYACWDWRFLFLLLFSTYLDYFTGLKMADSVTARAKKFWFWISISINLGILGLFKYYNFFITSFTDAMHQIGIEADPWTVKLILPIGISFYTFHGLSYVIDIYNDKIKAEKDFIDYSVFVSFFPLLIAGPIERATHLLPQIKKNRVFEYHNAVDGLKQILWGLFKKVVIADRCAFFANMIFNNSTEYSGIMLVIGAVFFAFQIYCDFSGYSDIALGVARLFGIELLQNFSFPYFSRDIAEFWRRWHISLSSWFRDYLYIPLGGSRGSIWLKIRNTFIIFLVSGFWHGANWTFIAWGFLNALYIMPSIIFKTNRNNLDVVAKGRTFPSVKELLLMSITFSLAVFAWIFFRAENITHALSYINGFFRPSFFNISLNGNWESFVIIFLLLLFFLIIEWNGREQKYAIANIGSEKSKIYRWSFYYFVLLLVLFFAGAAEEFIYFQF